MPDDQALLLEPFPTFLRTAVSEKPYRKYARFALNSPERMPLPEPFENLDPVAPLRETVDRLTAEQATPEPRKLTVDSKLDEAMEHRSPQFVLRNIPRVERPVDEWLEFTKTPDARPDQAHLLDDVRDARHLPPVLLDRFGVDVVREYRATTLRWTRDEDWTRYFSRELKNDAKGPLWQYDPNASPDPRTGAASSAPTADARPEENP
jgi:hypothetical protein